MKKHGLKTFEIAQNFDIMQQISKYTLHFYSLMSEDLLFCTIKCFSVAVHTLKLLLLLLNLVHMTY